MTGAGVRVVPLAAAAALTLWLGTLAVPPVDAQARRWLAEAVENKLIAAGRTANDARLAAIPAAAGTIALLDQWMTGHLDVPRADIARSLVGRVAGA